MAQAATPVGNWLVKSPSKGGIQVGTYGVSVLRQADLGEWHVGENRLVLNVVAA